MPVCQAGVNSISQPSSSLKYTHRPIPLCSVFSAASIPALRTPHQPYQATFLGFFATASHPEAAFSSSLHITVLSVIGILARLLAMSAHHFINRGSPNLGLRNMTFLAKPSIDISIPGAQGLPGAFIKSYSTLDKIEGSVTISARTDTRFDGLEITFNGMFIIPSSCYEKQRTRLYVHFKSMEAVVQPIQFRARC